MWSAQERLWGWQNEGEVRTYPVHLSGLRECLYARPMLHLSRVCGVGALTIHSFWKYAVTHSACVLSCVRLFVTPPASSVPGIFQARILECIAMSSSRGSPWPRDWIRISCLGRWVLYCWWATGAQCISSLKRWGTVCALWSQGNVSVHCKKSHLQNNSDNDVLVCKWRTLERQGGGILWTQFLYMNKYRVFVLVS